MEQPTLTQTKEFVRDLVDGQSVDSIFVVRERTLRQKRNGEAFLKLKLGDVTGAVEAVVWDGVDDLAPACDPGGVVRCSGRYAVDGRYGACVTVRSLRPADESEYDPADLLEGPPVAYDKMAEDLEQLVATVQAPHLRELLRRLLSRAEGPGERWHRAPAAKYYHQAYRHGLIEHCLSVAQGVSAMASTFPASTATWPSPARCCTTSARSRPTASDNGSIELTDAGRLQGEIPLGYYIVRREIERIEGFPDSCAEAVLHIVLSHHGKLEHGSPVVPCTREATLVHMIDNLGGTLGSFDRIEKSLADGERWSQFDRGISSSAYFAPREELPAKDVHEAA